MIENIPDSLLRKWAFELSLSWYGEKTLSFTEILNLSDYLFAYFKKGERPNLK